MQDQVTPTLRYHKTVVLGKEQHLKQQKNHSDRFIHQEPTSLVTLKLVTLLRSLTELVPSVSLEQLVFLNYHLLKLLVVILQLQVSHLMIT